MTTNPIRSGISAETESQSVGWGGGDLMLRRSPGVTIDVSWDHGDHDNALRVLNRLHREVRVKLADLTGHEAPLWDALTDIRDDLLIARDQVSAGQSNINVKLGAVFVNRADLTDALSAAARAVSAVIALTGQATDGR